MLVTDAQGRIQAANPAAIRLLESRDCPLLGSRITDLASPDDRHRILALLRRLRQSKRDALDSQIAFQAVDGNTRNASATLLALWEGDRVAAVSWHLRQVGQPPTLVGRLQQTRQEATDLRMALDQAAAVIELDRDGRITEANDRCTRLLARTREHLVGCTIGELRLGSRVTEALPDIRQRLVRGRAWGGELPVEIAGREVRWVNLTVVPLLDDDGRPRRYLVLLHDVTRRRRAVERLERERGLIQLGGMAAVVAHEVRNPLAAAQGALGVIGARMPASQDRAVLADVVERLSRLNVLVEDILLFARPRTLTLERQDLGELARQVVDELRADPGMEEIDLTLERPETECVLKLDAGAIRDVLLNLLQNAAAAMEGRGPVQVTVDLDEGLCRVRVRDRGHGIPEELHERIFEPFFTTRHRGTGLGLAIARRTVERHGGRLRLAPAPGGGTDAVVELPLGDDDRVAPSA